MNKLNDARADSVLVAIVVCLFILAAPSAVRAQKRAPIPPPPKPPSSEPSTSDNKPTPNFRTPDQATLEMQILMSRRWNPADAEREQRRAAGQLAFEMERLRQIEAETLSPAATSKAIDYKGLARATAEVKDRALKIKYGLPIVLKDRGEKVRWEADPSQLGTMLPKLSSMIKSFIDNPALRVNGPDDAALLANAGHDLEGIIKLSDTITKIAKSLAKPLVASK